MFTSVDKQCNKTHNIVCLNVGLQCLAREVGAVTSYDGSCPTSAAPNALLNGLLTRAMQSFEVIYIRRIFWSEMFTIDNETKRRVTSRIRIMT